MKYPYHPTDAASWHTPRWAQSSLQVRALTSYFDFHLNFKKDFIQISERGTSETFLYYSSQIFSFRFYLDFSCGFYTLMHLSFISAPSIQFSEYTPLGLKLINIPYLLFKSFIYDHNWALCTSYMYSMAFNSRITKPNTSSRTTTSIRLLTSVGLPLY